MVKDNKESFPHNPSLRLKVKDDKESFPHNPSLRLYQLIKVRYR